MKQQAFILFFSNLVSSIAITISLIIVPWKLASVENGPEIIGVVAAVSTLFLVIVSPVIGRFIDKCSRRNIIIFSILTMAMLICLCALLFSNHNYQTIALSSLFAGSQIFFLVFYNARNAFIQETFPNKEHAKVNSFMEVETQLSSFASLILSLVLVDPNHFQWLLMGCGIILIISPFPIFFIKKANISNARSDNKGNSNSFNPINKNILFLGLGAYTPFIVVMMLNIIEPVYFNKVLHVNIDYLIFSGLAYTSAATIMSMMASYILKNQSTNAVLRLIILVFPCVMFLVSLFPITLVIIIASALLGGINSLSKIAFNTYTMANVNRNSIGTFFGVLQSIIYAQRTLFAFLLALFFSYFGTQHAFIFTFIISTMGSLFLFISIQSRNVVKEKT